MSPFRTEPGLREQNVREAKVEGPVSASTVLGGLWSRARHGLLGWTASRLFNHSDSARREAPFRDPVVRPHTERIRESAPTVLQARHGHVKPVAGTKGRNVGGGDPKWLYRQARVTQRQAKVAGTTRRLRHGSCDAAPFAICFHQLRWPRLSYPRHGIVIHSEGSEWKAEV